MDLEGSIVEFVDSGALRMGYVRKREQRRVQIVDQRGRQTSVPRSRVLVVHESIPEEDFPAAANRILERVETCVSEIDVRLLWESLRGERSEFTLADLALAYFGSRSPENESAIYRRLEQENLYFRRTPGGFEPRSEEQVSSEQLRIAREATQTRLREEVTRILRRALMHDSTPEAMGTEEPWRKILEDLEKWMRRNEPCEASQALEKLVGEAQARETAFDLLARYGQIPASADRFLLVRGIPTDFPREAVEASRRLAMVDLAKRVTWPDEVTLAIDDEYTVEIDDALAVSEEGDQTVVRIHIADVSCFVTKDDSLDREAHRRSSTIYLPNVSVMMFPPRLSTDLASLVGGRARPALSVEARFSKDGTLVDFDFIRSAIVVTDRMNYREADSRLEAGDTGLRKLYDIATQLRHERQEQGAQTHRRPDVKVHVVGDSIRVERLEADTPARFIVSEMMILANRLAAAEAASSGIPIIFRTQESPREPRPETEGLPEVIQFELLRKNFKRSRLSLHPSPHAGLGLPCYTQMSSPIRRYADLVTQRQFVAALEGESLPYERDELLEVMTSCEARELEVRRLEQTSTNWWILTHIARERLEQPLAAIVVDNKGTIELTDFLIRARLREKDDLAPGDAITVRVQSADPEHGALRLAPME